MKNFMMLVCVVLLPFMLACANHPREDSVECAVEISWQGQAYSAREIDDTLREAREEAIEEACEIACHNADKCEDECERKAEIKSVQCKNRYTGEVMNTLI